MTNAMYKFESSDVREGKLERLRDEFAIQAMNSFAWAFDDKDACAKSCYQAADAMMKAREQSK